MVLSFDAWKGAKVNPTTHPVTVLPVKAGPRAEPVSPLRTGTLVHPDRKANVGQVKYSVVSYWRCTGGKVIHSRMDHT